MVKLLVVSLLQEDYAPKSIFLVIRGLQQNNKIITKQNVNVSHFKFMKFSLNLFVKNIYNLCVYQKGWNYFQIKFLNADVQLKSQQNIPVVSGIKPYNRYYDESTCFSYNNQTKTLTFPAIRIEYFDQLVEIHKVFSFIVHTNDNYLQIQHKIYFQHFPKEIPHEAPPISQCKTTFKKYVQLNNFKIPGLQYFDQMFSDNHAAKMEQTYMWMGINDSSNSHNQLLQMQDYLFKKLYKQSYFESLVQLSDATNLQKITNQLLKLKIQNTFNTIKEIPTIETLQQSYNEICQNILSQEKIDLATFEHNTESDIDGKIINNSQQSIIQYLCPVQKTQQELILNNAISQPTDQQQVVIEGSISSKTENLDELAQLDTEPRHPNLISQLSNQIYSEKAKNDRQLSHVQESLCDIAMKVRENIQTISHLNYNKHEHKVIFPTILMKYVPPFPTNYHDILNICRKKHMRYTNLQLQLLQEQQQRVQRHIVQLKVFNRIVQEAKSYFPQQKGAQLYIFVHGYKGSQYDFKFFKSILKTKFESLQLRQEIYYVVLDYAIATNTQILDLGYAMLHQLRKSIITAVRKPTFEECLQQIDDIHFIGFSMGNIVIESILSQFDFDYTEYEAIIKFNKKYKKSKITRETIQTVLKEAEQCCKKNLFLVKLNQYYSLNGPVLGTTKTNGLVNIGVGFLKTFGKGNVNVCLNELNVEFQPRKMFEQFKHRIRYLQEILDFDVKKRVEVTRFCKNETISELGQDGFKDLCLMDVLAFNSHLGFFKNIYLFASHEDGYVRFESAIGQVNRVFQGFLLQKYVNCEKIQRYVIKHDMKKFQESSYFDKTTGRCIHLAPLTDSETIDIITNLIINNV